MLFKKPEIEQMKPKDSERKEMIKRIEMNETKIIEEIDKIYKHISKEFTMWATKKELRPEYVKHPYKPSGKPCKAVRRQERVCLD